MSESKTSFADTPPPEEYPKLEYTALGLCIVDRFPGTKTMPLPVVFAYRPYTQQEMVASLDAEQKVSAALQKAEEKKDVASRVAFAKALAQRQFEEVVARLVRWDLKDGHTGEPCEVSEEAVRNAPSAVIAFIAHKINESGRAVETVVKNSEGPSDLL